MAAKGPPHAFPSIVNAGLPMNAAGDYPAVAESHELPPASAPPSVASHHQFPGDVPPLRLLCHVSMEPRSRPRINEQQHNVDDETPAAVDFELRLVSGNLDASGLLSRYGGANSFSLCEMWQSARSDIELENHCFNLDK